MLLFVGGGKVCAQIDAEGVMRIGRNALFYEDYALSIQYFNQAIAAKPYLYTPYFYRAIAKYYLGDYNGAVSDCSMSIERDPYIPGVYRLRAINYIRTDNFPAAAKDYYTLIRERGVKDRDVWYNLVLCEVEMKQMAEADTLLDSMIVRWPDYSRCYLLKAQVALSDSDTIKALKLMDRTIELDPNDIDALAAKAVILLQRQEYKESESVYDQAIALSPRQTPYYINRAMARYQQKNLRGAMDDYNTALQLSPDNYLAHYNRALLSMRVGENNRAIEDFDFVLLKHPNDRLALYNRATLSQQTGDYRAAIRDYSTIIHDFPNFAAAYVNRSYCYRRVGDNRRSDADDRRVIEIRLNEVYKNKTYSSPLDMVTRSQDDDDIENYDKLVTDSVDNVVPFYASEYRGRVQNREYSTQLQPLYVLTFSVADNGLYRSAALSKAHFVDLLNSRCHLYSQVSLSAKEAPMTAADYQTLNSETAAVGDKLEANPSDTTLLLAHALYLMQGRDYESAVQELNQYLHRNPSSVAALFLRATAKAKLMEMQSQKTNNNGVGSTNAVNPTGNISGINNHVGGMSNNGGVTNNLGSGVASSLAGGKGNVVSGARNIAGGVNDNLAGTITSNAINIGNNNLLGGAIFGNNIASAIIDLTSAIAHEPDCAYLYYNRGCLYAAQGDYNNAKTDFSEALHLNPSLAEAYYNRALCSYNLNDKSSAISDMSKADELGIFTAYSLIKQFNSKR